MAGNVSGLHVFQADTGPIPLSLLDTNYSSIVNSINSLGTFSNYYVDSGAAGSVVVTVPAPQSFAYGDGVFLQVKIAATNTADAPTINVNGLGAKLIVNPDGSTVAPGQLAIGSIVQLQFLGTSFQLVGASSVAFGSFPTTLSGPFTVNPTGTLKWVKVGKFAGIWCDADITGTATGASPMGASGMPADITPSSNRFIPCAQLLNNSVVCMGIALPQTGGLFFNVMSVSGSAIVPASFTGAGTAGIKAQCAFVYSL